MKGGFRVAAVFGGWLWFRRGKRRFGRSQPVGLDVLAKGIESDHVTSLPRPGFAVSPRSPSIISFSGVHSIVWFYSGMDSEIETGSGPVTQNQTTPANRLDELEAIVDKGKATFLEVGAALIEIHDSGLYKQRYDSWAEYLKERFGYSRQHAHRLMQAKRLADASPMGDKPKTEREARRRRQGKSTRSSNKVTSLPDDYSSMPTGIVRDLEAEISGFEEQMSRWEKFLCTKDRIVLLERLSKIINDTLSTLDARYVKEEAG
jgi:hypothetical protein